MKKMKSFLLLLTLIISLSSCATNYEEEKSVLLAKDETTDLTTTFDLDHDQAQIFKDKSLSEKTITAPPLQVEVAVKTKTKGKVKDKKTPKVVVAAAVSPAHDKTEAAPEYSDLFKGYDQKSKLSWDKFKPVFYQGEQSIMSVTYLGVTAGYITIMSKEVVSVNNKDAFHFFARFKSSDSYRYFYWLDDKLDSYVEKETFLPLKYSLIQREKKQNVDDLQLFDFEKLKTFFWYKRVKEGSNKDEKGNDIIPKLAQDSFSALQFVRGLPLVKGDTYEFPVITRGKYWLLKVDVLGEETTSVDGKDTRAIKIKAETNFPGVLKKSGDIYFWYGVDSERRLLKFQAKIKIGSIYGELVEYKPGIKVP